MDATRPLCEPQALAPHILGCPVWPASGSPLPLLTTHKQAAIVLTSNLSIGMKSSAFTASKEDLYGMQEMVAADLVVVRLGLLLRAQASASPHANAYCPA